MGSVRAWAVGFAFTLGLALVPGAAIHFGQGVGMVADALQNGAMSVGWAALALSAMAAMSFLKLRMGLIGIRAAVSFGEGLSRNAGTFAGGVR